MRIDGAGKLIRQLRALPKAQRREIEKVMRRTVDSGVRMAETLAPDVTHETKGNIYGTFDPVKLEGAVIGIRSDAPRPDKDRAYSIEHGRPPGPRGRMRGFRFMARTRRFLAKSFGRRMRRAINKAARKVTRG